MQPVQLKMARAALDLSVDALAGEAHIPADAIHALESGAPAQPDTAQGLNLFFASRGIELIDGDGVRAKSAQAADFVTVDELTTANDGGEG